jgi:hypothetical protein
MRNDRQGMPVETNRVRDGPPDVLPGKTTHYSRVFVNVKLVVVVHELVPKHLPKDQPRDKGEASANSENRRACWRRCAATNPFWHY